MWTCGAPIEEHLSIFQVTCTCHPGQVFPTYFFKISVMGSSSSCFLVQIGDHSKIMAIIRITSHLFLDVLYFTEPLQAYSGMVEGRKKSG